MLGRQAIAAFACSFGHTLRRAGRPIADVARQRMILISSPMIDSSIEHLWSNLWASRLGAEDVRLRFELGGEKLDNTTQQIPRFLQAHRRASAVADALFNESCVGIVAWNGRKPKSLGIPRVKDGFDALRSTGFHARHTDEWQATLYPDPSDDDAYIWTLRSYEMSRDKVARDTILWHAIAAEMPIYPSAPVVTFLVDPASSLMLHVYDDRGMDVVVDEPAKLRETYFTFTDWLLDYDRERMTKLF